MKKYLIFFLLTPLIILFPQYIETEENGLCTDLGVQTITTISVNPLDPTTIQGEIPPAFPVTDNDIWLIEQGLSGTLTIDVTSVFGTATLYSSSGAHCNSTTSLGSIQTDDDPLVVTLNQLLFYQINVTAQFGTLIPPYTISLALDAELPVELTSFNVALDNNLVQLNWETSTEVNNYGFEIQKSVVKEDWSKIGFVEGHGNSNSPKYYTYTDKSVESSGEYSYRLKQVDIDGTFEYSDIVEVNIEAPNKFELSRIIQIRLIQLHQ